MALTCLVWQYRTCGSLHRFFGLLPLCSQGFMQGKMVVWANAYVHPAAGSSVIHLSPVLPAK